MKNILLISFLILISMSAQAQDLQLYDSARTVKKKINKANHIKLKKQKKSRIKLNDTLTVDADEIALPPFKLITKGKNGKEKKEKFKMPKQFKIKRKGKTGILTVTDDGILGEIDGDNITDEGVVKDTTSIPYEQAEPPDALEYVFPTLPLNTETISEGTPLAINPKVARLCWVVDYDIYTNMGKDLVKIGNFFANLQAAKLVYYNAIGINNVVIELTVLTEPSIYSSLTDSYSALTKFANTYYGTKPDIHLMHLFTNKSYGGLAYLNGIVNPNARYAVSGIFNNLNVINGYSWTIGVTAHEEGHNYGSRHTQYCGWVLPNGSVGRLDSCVAGESYGGINCGSFIKTPTAGGTIMSYCHISGKLVLANGFHPACGAVMRFNLENSNIAGETRPRCTSYTTSAWSPCIRGFETRTIVSSLPVGCVGVAPTILYPSLIRNCVSVPCSTWITTWTPCNEFKLQALVFAVGVPNNCAGGYTGPTSRTCTTTSVPCTYTYSAWSSCVNGTQTRTVTSFPVGCVGTPILSQSCTTQNIKTITYSGTTHSGITANATDGNLTTRYLTTGPFRVQFTYSAPVSISQVFLNSGFQGGSPNQTLTLTVDGVNVPLGFTRTINFSKAINFNGKVFVLTTTGTGNISRVFEIGVK
jgi:hypothetical protein